MEHHDWKDLQMASAVHRHGSLSGAARELGVVPSTLHRRVTSLEERLGVTLFVRHRSGYTLTDAGAYVLQALEPMELAMAELHRRALNRSQHTMTTVTLSAPSLLAARICALLPELFERAPTLRVILSGSENISDIKRGAADIVVRVTNEPDESLWGQRLGFLDFVIAGQRTYVESLGESWRERARWIVYDDSLRHTPQYQWERATLPLERCLLEVSARHVQVEAMRHGCGLGLVPGIVVSQDETLMAVGPPLEDIRLGLWILTHQTLKENEGVRELMSFLGERGRAILERNAQVT